MAKIVIKNEILEMMINNQINPKRSGMFIIAMMTIFLSGCYVDDDIPFPDVYVDAYIDLYDPQYQETVFTVYRDYDGNMIGNYGIIVYCPDLYTAYAYDRMCPHDVDSYCMVEDMHDGTVMCPCCQSRFVISNSTGYVVSGPSRRSLKTYRTEILDDGFLHVYSDRY